jgi:hypothetical protein
MEEDVNLQEDRRTGRPTSFTQEVASNICDRIMEGEMLTKICAEEGMPSRITFYGWMANRPEFKDAYARARLAWADWWAERVLAISLDSSGDIFVDEAGKAVIDHANVQRARLQADTIKWLVGKYAPRTYGDRPIEEAKREPTVINVITGVARDGDTTALFDDEPKPPKQITYKKPELPADLTEQDWSIMLEVLELVKRTVPTNDERPPEEIFGVIREALLAHFRKPASACSMRGAGCAG